MEYRYEHFQRKVLTEDRGFGDVPRPGDPMPTFDLPTTDARRVRKADYTGRKPLLLIFGSITCPMTKSSAPALRKLYDRFQDQVEFLTVYVREAHPGEKYPQPNNLDDKISHARAYRTRDEIPWSVAVDDIDGTFHRRLGGNPASVWLMGTDGRLLFRCLWSNDIGPLKRALAQATEDPTRVIGERKSTVLPLLTGLGYTREVLSEAGPSARRDYWKEAAPVAAMGEAAGWLRPLGGRNRGFALLTLVVTTLVGLVGLATISTAGRRRR